MATKKRMGNQFTDAARVDVKFCYHFSSPFTRTRSAVPLPSPLLVLVTSDLKNLSIHMLLLPCLKLSFRIPFDLTLNLTTLMTFSVITSFFLQVVQF